jgi:hypothetical protein
LLDTLHYTTLHITSLPYQQGSHLFDLIRTP